VGIEDWLAACRDDLVPGIPLGDWGDAHLANPPKSRGLRPCRGGDRVFACRSAFLLLGVANPPDAWTLGMAAGLVVRAAFLLLGVAFLLLGVGFLPDRWQLVGVPFLLIRVAALLGGVAALLDGWTLVGVALLLSPVTALLLGVAFLLDRWARLESPSCWARSQLRHPDSP
jgi:hypothetical protein